MRHYLTGAILTHHFPNTLLTHAEIFGIHFDSDTVTTPSSCGRVARSSSHERIEHRIADKTKHTNKTFGQFHGVRSWMFLG